MQYPPVIYVRHFDHDRGKPFHRKRTITDKKTRGWFHHLDQQDNVNVVTRQCVLSKRAMYTPGSNMLTMNFETGRRANRRWSIRRAVRPGRNSCPPQCGQEKHDETTKFAFLTANSGRAAGRGGAQRWRHTLKQGD